MQKKISTKIDAKALLSQNQQTSQINKILKMCMLKKIGFEFFFWLGGDLQLSIEMSW